MRRGQTIVTLIVAAIIIMTAWEQTQSVELFLTTVLILCGGIYAIHRRTQQPR